MLSLETPDFEDGRGRPHCRSDVRKRARARGPTSRARLASSYPDGHHADFSRTKERSDDAAAQKSPKKAGNSGEIFLYRPIVEH